MVFALGEQIKGHLQPIIERKRSQNSLLNISRLPPEILGYIFWLTSVPGEFQRGCLNFLFVCHHWYEVALRTPELWNYWGSTLQDWTRCHLRYPEIPLDLVLDADSPRGTPLCTSVQNTLRDRAARYAIRLVHLRSEDVGLLDAILRTITVDQEVVRCSRVESLILQNQGDIPVDAPAFFTHTRFPNLRHLNLTHREIPHWDDLISQTKHLTTLVLHLNSPSSIPTMPKLLSLLAFNPSLQKLALTGDSLPEDQDGGRSQVSLPLLKELELAGECKDISILLGRMVYPGVLDRLDISLDGCEAGDIPDTIGPYLQDYFRRRGRSQSGLKMYTSFAERRLTLRIGDVDSLRSPTEADSFLVITITAPHDPIWKLLLSLLAHTPHEEIVYLRACGDFITPFGGAEVVGSLYALLPNLRELYSKSMALLIIFSGPGAGGEDRYPSQSLRYVSLERMTLCDWTPLTYFLSFSPRASPSKRLDFLHVASRFRMGPEVEDVIRSSVREFSFTHLC